MAVQPPRGAIVAQLPSPWRRRGLAAIVGAAAGALSGLFGIGGGALIVPGLVGALALGQRTAHGTSLAAVLPIALAGSIGYLRGDAVDLLAVVPLALGSTVGALIGARLLDRMREGPLRRAFAVLLVVVAVQLLLSPPVVAADAVARGPATFAALVALGLVTGTAAGLLGIGGGVIVVPGLILLLGVSDVVAKGTSLALIVPTSLVGTFSNVRRGNTDLSVAAWTGGAGMATGYLAARVSLGLEPRLSVTLFAAFLLIVAGRTFFRP